MQEKTVQIRGVGRRELARRIRALPRILSGKSPDRNRIASTFQARLARNLMKQIHEAFLVKSEGDADSTGESWKPLSRKTIAYRPIPGRPTAGRGLLSSREDTQWRAIFRSQFVKLAVKMGEQAAKIQAAKIAWGIMKSRGARTKLDVYGGRKVKMLIVSHRLEKSLRPGRVSGGSYRGPAEQVFQISPSLVILGSKVPYAAHQHRTRRLWPPVRKMLPWITQAAADATDEIVEAISAEGFK